MKRSRAKLLLLAAVSVAVFCGCWDREELENLGMVLTLGLDSAPGNKVEVTAQVAVPSKLAPSGNGGGGQGGGQDLPTEVVTNTAATIAEALMAMNRTVNRRVTLAQNRAIIVGEETARRGLMKQIGMITRHREFRRTMQIMVVKGRARKALNLKPKLEINPAEYLLDLARLSRYTGETDLIDMNDFVQRLEQPGISPCATYLIPEKPEGKTGDGGEGGGGQQGGAEASSSLRIGGLAVFKGDRMIGVIGPEEVPGYLILNRRFMETFLSLPDPHEQGELILLQLKSAQSRVIPFMHGRDLRVRIEVKIEADLVGTESAKDYTTPVQERMIEKAAAQKIERQLQALMRKAQKEFGVDPFGLGLRFRPLVPTWRDWLALRWDQRFPEVPVSLSVQLHLRRFGMQREAPSVR